MTTPFVCVMAEFPSVAAIGSAIEPTESVPNWWPSTDSSGRRAYNARYAMTLTSNYVFRDAGGAFVRNNNPYNATTFYTTARVNTNGDFSAVGYFVAMRWADASSIVRLRIRLTGSANVPASLFVVEKINAAGTVTILGTSSDVFLPAAALPIPDKIDVFIDYSTTGSVVVTRTSGGGGPATIFSYTGDVTTDGVTALAYTHLGGVTYYRTYWTECFTTDRNTIDCPGLVTQTPVGPGPTTTFTSGSYTAVNGFLLNRAGAAYSLTAGQTAQWELSPMPSGTYSVAAVVQQIDVTAGAAGPANALFDNNISGADFTSAPFAGGSWHLQENVMYVDPATTVTWLPATLTAMSLGVQSAT